MPYLSLHKNHASFYQEKWEVNAAQLRDSTHPWLQNNFIERINLSAPPVAGEGTEVALVIEQVKIIKNDKVRIKEIEVQKNTVQSFFEEVVGKKLQKNPPLLLLWNALSDFSGYPIMKLKARYNRARPYEVDTVNQLFKVGHPSYPSGHSTQGHLMAFVFAELYPSKRADLVQLATRIALNRELAGVHFRSDSIAGVELAREIYLLLPEIDRYRELLARAKEAI
jgi:PAP2 superfamily